ncbi:MAG TPA: VCBS repeat-containing protein [Polyangia bacterium]|jgi:hypothetical protein|nr:VCBS repeat-containing protein [Polyangia bacterium]
MRATIGLLCAAAASSIQIGCDGCGGSLSGAGGNSGQVHVTGSAGAGVSDGGTDVSGRGGAAGFAGFGGFTDTGVGGFGGWRYDCAVPSADGGVASDDGGNRPTELLPALGLRAPLAYSNVSFASALGDVNGDGKDDLVTVGTQVTVRINDGSGRLGTPIDVASGVASDDNGADPILMGDLNGDRSTDVVYVHSRNYPALSVTVLLGDGAGGFAPEAEYRAGSGAASLAMGDLDGDGDLDLVLFSNEYEQPGELDVLMNAGDGTFAPAVKYAAGLIRGPLAIADLDGDARNDVVVGGYPSESVLVYANRGNGQLMLPVAIPAGVSPVDFALGDVDGDGKADIVVVNQVDRPDSNAQIGGLPSTVSVVRNRGNGSFAVPVSYAVGIEAWDALLVDLNGDGKLDVVVTNMNTTDASVLTNKGDGTFAGEVRLGVGGSPAAILVGEMNGDGRPDLAFISVSWDLAVVLSTGQGALGAGIDYATGMLPPYPLPVLYGDQGAIAAGDIDGDGKPDLVANGTLPYDQDMKLLQNTGAGTFGPASILYGTFTASPAVLAIADLNGDGKPDLVSGDYAPCVSLNTGGGELQFSGCHDAGLDETDPVALALGDVNKDGKPDLVVVRWDVTWTLLNPGDGNFDGVPPQLSDGARTNTQSAVLADLHNDGTPDLVIARPGAPGTPGGVQVAYGAGDGYFVEGPFLLAGSSPVSVAVADLDGDGRADIAVGNAVNATCTGSQGTLDVLFADGKGGFGGAARYGGGGYSTIAAADIDGDGDADLLALDAIPQDGGWTHTTRVNVFVNDGRGRFGAPVSFATAANATAMTVRDLNGDGRLDIAVATNRETITVLLNGP